MWVACTGAAQPIRRTLARCGIRHRGSAFSEEISDKPAAPQSLADRLRAGSKALDHEEIATRLAAIRQSREVEGQDKAREVEREARRVRDKGLDHEL